jgi:hypothetical protein
LPRSAAQNRPQFIISAVCFDVASDLASARSVRRDHTDIRASVFAVFGPFGRHVIADGLLALRIGAIVVDLILAFRRESTSRLMQEICRPVSEWIKLIADGLSGELVAMHVWQNSGALAVVPVAL